MKMRRKKDDENPMKSLPKEKSAVLLVGSTGTGKSSTISKCTGLTLRVGDGHRSITKSCGVYEGENDLVWIDTVGWDDMDGDDMEIFQSVLQFLNRHNLTKLKAVLWTIHPGSIRSDATLTKQAKLINLFADKTIWNNVIIICKQAMNPEHEARGALNAGYAFNNLSKLQVVGYRYLDDPSLTGPQRSLFENEARLKREMNVLDDDEVKELLMGKLKQISLDIQIIFNQYKCRSCGVEGDNRLLPQFCHMEKESVHLGSFERQHKLGLEKYHPSNNYIYEHSSGLKSPCCGGCYCLPSCNQPKKWACCGRYADQEGCVQKWACCKRILTADPCKTRYRCCLIDREVAVQGCETIYSCCGQDLKSQGCVEVCKKCMAKWGTEAKECFPKCHDLELVGVDL